MTKLVLTVGSKAQPGDDDRARAIAARHGLPFLERSPKQALEPLLSQYNGIFVSARNGLTLWTREGTLRWSEGMAHLRVERLNAGDGMDDVFIKLADLRPGESVLDCTLGLAQDALVAARVVSPAGRVVGVEKSRPVYILTTEALAEHHHGEKSCRVETIHADAADYMATLPSKFFDVVVFDPMHARAGKSQPQFEGLRHWADYSELTGAMIGEARRVARRLVLVKGSRYSQDLKKLGLVAEPLRAAASVVWARVPAT